MIMYVAMEWKSNQNCPTVAVFTNEPDAISHIYKRYAEYRRSYYDDCELDTNGEHLLTSLEFIADGRDYWCVSVGGFKKCWALNECNYYAKEELE